MELNLKPVRVVLGKKVVRKFLAEQIKMNNKSAVNEGLDANTVNTTASTSACMTTNQTLLLAMDKSKFVFGINVFHSPQSTAEHESIDAYVEHSVKSALEVQKTIENSAGVIPDETRIEINPDIDANTEQNLQALYCKIQLHAVERQMASNLYNLKISLDRNKVNTCEAVAALNRIRELIPQITVTMLRNNPDWIQTMQKLQTYVGCHHRNAYAKPLIYSKFGLFCQKIRILTKLIYVNYVKKLSENFGLENHLMEVDEENGRVNLKSGLCN